MHQQINASLIFFHFFLIYVKSINVFLSFSNNCYKGTHFFLNDKLVFMKLNNEDLQHWNTPHSRNLGP